VSTPIGVDTHRFLVMASSVLGLCLMLPLLGTAAAFSNAPVLVAGRATSGWACSGLGRVRLFQLHRSSSAGLLRQRDPIARGAAAVAAAGRRGVTMTASPVEFNIFNTLARDKVPFKPMAADGKTVKMYTCGPTVYDFAHIGNFRAFLTYDLVKRWLLYCGYDVDHVCNLTDVDDKIITRMKRDNVGLKELTDKYATFFFEDLDRYACRTDVCMYACMHLHSHECTFTHICMPNTL